MMGRTMFFRALAAEVSRCSGFLTVMLAAAMLSTTAVAEAGAQERYTYTVSRTHTRTIPINWRPDSTSFQRYTVAVRPLSLVSNGLRFDFEYELPRTGYWIQTSIIGRLAPARHRSLYPGGRDDGNNRSGFVSAWDDYNRMWGIGTSALFKNMFSRRGWYFSTGVVLEFFRVGVMADSYIPYKEDGLTFYDAGRKREAKSYFKPTAQINFGKHLALSRRCFFDLYVGLGVSYSLYKDDDRHAYTYDGGDYRWRDPLFEEIGGFAYRGIQPQGGFRIGVLLWEPEEGGRFKFRR